MSKWRMRRKNRAFAGPGLALLLLAAVPVCAAPSDVIVTPGNTKHVTPKNAAPEQGVDAETPETAGDTDSLDIDVTAELAESAGVVENSGIPGSAENTGTAAAAEQAGSAESTEASVAAEQVGNAGSGGNDSSAQTTGAAVLVGAGAYTYMRVKWKEKEKEKQEASGKEPVYFENHTKTGTLRENERTDF